MIRKSVYGRSDLFLPNETETLREIKAQGGIVSVHTARVWHTLPSLLRTRGLSCWHCCERFEHEPIPIPKTYDPGEEVFHVFGATCSPGCAKAYVIEYTSFNRGNNLDVFARMMRQVYGVTGRVLETPPRVSLKRFGGPFDPPSAPSARHSACTLIEPPFVSYCMIVEEQLAGADAAAASGASGAAGAFPAPSEEGDDAIEGPCESGLFDDFVRHATAPAAIAQSSAQSSANPKKRPTTASKSATGPISKFTRGAPSTSAASRPSARPDQNDDLGRR